MTCTIDVEDPFSDLLCVTDQAFSSSAFAAGPSYVTIWMDPVAVNPSGQILLRTFYRSNHSDGQPLPGSEIRFGWLISLGPGPLEGIRALHHEGNGGRIRRRKEPAGHV